MFSIKKIAAAGAIAIAAAIVPSGASAQVTTIDIDLNNFRVTGDIVSATEWTLSMIDDHDTTIVAIRRDGSDAPGFYDPFAGATSADYSAIVNLSGTKSAGVVSSGIFQLEDDLGNVLSFDEVSGTYLDSGSQIEVVLLLSSDDGEFNSDTFSGVDVADFNAALNFDVSIVTFRLDRKLLTLNGFTDGTADTDIQLRLIPSPTVASSLALVGVLGLLRRRRAA